MWISLMTTKQTRTLVNFSEVLHVNEHPTGSQIIFANSQPAIYVQEPIETIEKILKTRKPRW